MYCETEDILSIRTILRLSFSAAALCLPSSNVEFAFSSSIIRSYWARRFSYMASFADRRTAYNIVDWCFFDSNATISFWYWTICWPKSRSIPSCRSRACPYLAFASSSTVSSRLWSDLAAANHLLYCTSNSSYSNLRPEITSDIRMNIIIINIIIC